MDFFLIFPGLLGNLGQREDISNSALSSHRYCQDRVIPDKWASAYDWHYLSFILGRPSETINPTSLGRPRACPDPAHECAHVAHAGERGSSNALVYGDTLSAALPVKTRDAFLGGWEIAVMTYF